MCEIYFFKLNNKFNKIAAKVAVPIPPKLKLPNNSSKLPAPKIIVTDAMIKFLLLEKSTLFSIQIFAPAMVIKPNTTIEAPVSTAVGMVLITAPNLGESPKKMAKTPAITNTMVE